MIFFFTVSFWILFGCYPFIPLRPFTLRLNNMPETFLCLLHCKHLHVSMYCGHMSGQKANWEKTELCKYTAGVSKWDECTFPVLHAHSFRIWKYGMWCISDLPILLPTS